MRGQSDWLCGVKAGIHYPRGPDESAGKGKLGAGDGGWGGSGIITNNGGDTSLYEPENKKLPGIHRSGGS